MKFSLSAAIAVALGFAASVEAHTRVYGVFVNGNWQGDGGGVYVRQPPTNNPLKDVTQQSINCNVNNNPVSKYVEVKAGDKITFEWYHDYRGDDIIETSHKGPVMVWVAEASTNGNGAVWTKLAEDGLSNGQWAVDKLIQNKGKHDVTVPSWLAPGDYLFKAEIIALHEGETQWTGGLRGAQLYPSCSQFRVTSGGSTKPGQNFNFVGGYAQRDPGIVFDLYTKPPPTTYPIPGPRPWNPTSKIAKKWTA
ncbi:glycoside hydrolase family 61 protein [Peziza echinospora]|nr:glycoside hydrolase family 61 protein [Peziza echinospora]